LSDLRESGSIEQDADVVMFVYREEYYLANKEPKPNTDEHAKWLAAIHDAHGKADLIIGKQRHGPTGTVQLQFDAEVTRFDNLALDRQLPEQF
jgi:replicative DNA helicase